MFISKEELERLHKILDCHESELNHFKRMFSALEEYLEIQYIFPEAFVTRPSYKSIKKKDTLDK